MAEGMYPAVSGSKKGQNGCLQPQCFVTLCEVCVYIQTHTSVSMVFCYLILKNVHFHHVSNGDPL